MGSEHSIDKFLNEAKDYIKKEDPVQASEKLYKCSEESVKLLAEKSNLPEYVEAKDNEKWNARLLFSAVSTLSERVSPEIRRYWDTVWFLHVEGFHEMRLNIDRVKERVQDIENLLELAKKEEVKR